MDMKSNGSEAEDTRTLATLDNIQRAMNTGDLNLLKKTLESINGSDLFQTYERHVRTSITWDAVYMW